MIDLTARHVSAHTLTVQGYVGDAPSERQHLQTIMDEALQWVTHAREIGHFNRPQDSVVEAFNSWLTAIHLPLPSQLPYRISSNANDSVCDALIDTVNVLATHHPDLFPARYYEALAGRFTPYYTLGRIQVRHHQMLGHVPSSQDVKAIGDEEICLLQFWSDFPRGMTFGDAGECTFWIKPADLAAQRFDKAWATIEGG